MDDEEAAARPSPFLLQIIGYKNSGKTTLTAGLIRLFKREGYRVGTVKHDAHDFTMDSPGTDTWKHQEAGADVTAIGSARRSAILLNASATLPELLEHMPHTDIVLVEGFKREIHPKLVLVRAVEDIALLDELAGIAAIVYWPAVSSLASAAACRDGKPKLFGIDDTENIFDFVRSLLAAQAASP